MLVWTVHDCSSQTMNIELRHGFRVGQRHGHLERKSSPRDRSFVVGTNDTAAGLDSALCRHVVSDPAFLARNKVSVRGVRTAASMACRLRSLGRFGKHA